MAAYSVTSIFVILTFGSGGIDIDVMKSYDAEQLVVLIGNISLAVKSVATYPLLLFCAKIALQDIYLRLRRPATEEGIERYIIVVVWFVSTVIIGSIAPDIRIAIDSLGLIAALLMLIFPGLCLISAILQKNIDTSPKIYLLKDKIYIFLGSIYTMIGAFILGLTFTQAIQTDFIREITSNKVKLCS